ncbi:uncharacterized protein [Dendropsophus ebraccatus]|uniref:uncharacterized protein n=1 Tax=Dendropsophus ebraccatus TaxID=150705 RepID=UPI0038316BA7
MRSVSILPWIVGFLLHVTWGTASDPCLKGNVLPTNISQINGLWNLKAFGAHKILEKLSLLKKVEYSYAKISLTEKGGTVTESFNPIDGIYGGVTYFERVDGEKETLTYRKVTKEVPKLYTLYNLHPDVLIINRYSENIEITALYERSSTHPEPDVDEFKEWAKCKGLIFLKDLNITGDYAQHCYGFLEEKTPLHLKTNEDIFTTWHLVAKSSSSMDQHYNVRILYTAWLEISKNEGEITLKEIISAPNDNIISEMKFENPSKDGNLALTFKTEDGLLLLGIQTEKGRTLYLASRTPKVRQSVIENFKTEAMCFETNNIYFIPGRIREDDGGAEACAHHLEKWVPINFRESVGKWVLMVSAYEDTNMVLMEVLSPYGSTVIEVVDDKVHFSHVSIAQGAVITMKDIEVEESTGHIIYKDDPETRAAVHSVSPNCIVLSPEGRQRQYFICRANHFPTSGDISQFVKHATCRKFNKLLIRQPASFLCSEMPAEVQNLDVEKIAGTWTLAAAASNIPEGDVNFPNEIQFTVNDGEVTITDGNWKSTARKIGNNRLKYAKGHEHAMEMRFHEPLGDSLLTWVGNPVDHKAFLILFSKSGQVGPTELMRFKQFAACLSIPVMFVKE